MKTRLSFLLLFLGIISHSQTVSVVNGNLKQPLGVAIDPLGFIVIADTGNNSIVKFSTLNSSSTPVVNLELNNPCGIAVKGNVIYIADTGNGIIKKFVAPGTLTPLGYGHLSAPRGVAADNSGNVYVTSGSSIIRMTGTGSNITSLAGGLVSPEGITIDDSDNFIYFTCGDGTVKRMALNGTGLTTIASGLASPSGVAVDWSGNVFVAEYSNSAIKKITSAGVLSTYATGLQGPYGVAVNNSSGNVFVTEAYTDQVKMIAPDGTATAIKRLHYPTGIVCDPSGNLYITDTTSHNIKKLNNSGELIAAIGPACNSPYGMAIRLTTNSIFIANTYNNSIDLFNYVTNTGNPLISGGILNRPHAIAVDQYYMYIANTNSNTILKRDGASIFTFGNNGEFYMPMGIALDAAGHIFVADTGHQAIKRMTTSGSDITTIATGFTFPTGVLVDSSGRIYVADRGNNNDGKIVVLNSSGAVLSTITTGLSMPYSITFDSNGDVLITDIGDKKIKKLNVASLTVTEVSSENAVITYPNPTTDLVHILSNEGIKTVTLFDLSGKLIMNKDNPENEISLTHYPKGIYLMKITLHNGTSETKKIVKE